MTEFNYKSFGGSDTVALSRGSLVAPLPRVQRWSPAVPVKMLVFLSDTLAAICAFVIAALAISIVQDFFGERSDPWFFLADRAGQLGILVTLMLAVFSFGGLYSRTTWEAEEIKRVFFAVGLIALFDAALQFLVKDHTSRLWFLMAWPMVGFLALMFRAVVRAHPVVRRALTSNVLLVGGGIGPDEFGFQLRQSQANPVRVLGTIGARGLAGRNANAVRVLMQRVARDHGLTMEQVQVVLAPAPDEADLSQEVIGALRMAEIPVSLALPVPDLAQRGMRLHKVTGADMVVAEITPQPVPYGEEALKRGLDVAIASLAVLALAPVFAILGMLLSLERGPVFFRQIRVGRDGLRFKCIKFRTMRPDAEARLVDLLATDPAAKAEWETHQKLAFDPRITPVGHFLRKTSLDELPQLFNVLRGDMSLVGPRPIVAPEIPGYASDHAYFESAEFAGYLSCRPGITGLWQVAGRATTTHEERVRLDCWYARNRSIWLDTAILFKTVRVVFARSGS